MKLKGYLLSYDYVKKAVVPMGGLGTRLLPGTTVVPKELFPIINKPLIHLIVEEIVDAGIKDIIFVLSKEKENIYKYFNEIEQRIEQLKNNKNAKEIHKVSDIAKRVNIQVVYQDEPHGLGHAVLCAQELVGDDVFAVLLPDDMIYSETSSTLKEMVDIFNEKKYGVIASCEVKIEDVSKYGILSTDESQKRVFKINSIIEKPLPKNTPSTLAVAGRYILKPNIFKYLSKLERGSGGEVQLTDAIAKAMRESDFYGYRFPGERIDCGADIGLIKAHIVHGLRDKNMKDELLSYMQDKLKLHSRNIAGNSN